MYMYMFVQWFDYYLMQGQWEDNMMQGKGRWDYACGAFYRGQVKNGVKHGKGIYTWPNGTVSQSLCVCVCLASWLLGFLPYMLDFDANVNII